MLKCNARMRNVRINKAQRRCCCCCRKQQLAVNIADVRAGALSYSSNAAMAKRYIAITTKFKKKHKKIKEPIGDRAANVETKHSKGHRLRCCIEYNDDAEHTLVQYSKQQAHAPAGMLHKSTPCCRRLQQVLRKGLASERHAIALHTTERVFCVQFECDIMPQHNCRRKSAVAANAMPEVTTDIHDSGIFEHDVGSEDFDSDSTDTIMPPFAKPSSSTSSFSLSEEFSDDVLILENLYSFGYTELLEDCGYDHSRTTNGPNGHQPHSFIHRNAAAAKAAANASAANEIPNEYDEIINGGDCITYNNNNLNDNNNHQKKTATTNLENATVIANGDSALHKIASHALEKKAFSKPQLQQPARKVLQQKQQNQSTNPLATKNNLMRLDYANGLDLQQLKLLQRHSYGGGGSNLLDYTAATEALYNLEHERLQQHKSVEALGVLLQYLVFDLDAFACPLAKLESAKAKDSLSKTLHLLDEAKHACSELQEQICDKEAYFTQREQELQTLHRCELEKAQASLAEFQQLARDRLSNLEQQLAAKDTAHKAALEAYKHETDQKYAQKLLCMLDAQEREQKLQQRLQDMECAEVQLREQLTHTEITCANRLKAATEREQALEDRIRSLNRELEALRIDKEHSERELKDRLNLTQDEVSVLRTSRKSLERASSPRVSLGNTSNSSLNEITRLESEAESLRCVLELKQKEISKLTKHNEELLRDADERISLQGKISLLESKNELLQSELNIKSDREKELLRQIDEVQKALGHETTKRTRLSYDNEALQWQLKQRSEQLHIVEAKLQESLNASSCTHNSSNGSQQQRVSMLNGSVASVSMDDISPPASPVVKGVIEKVDSVSWVLEMDDDTPETAATKIVKRAGSFRAGERSPATKRQLNTSGNGSSTSPTPIPLSQSMSATAVVIGSQHSSEQMQTEFPNRTHPRVRSKSMTVKHASDGSGVSVRSAKRLTRQLSANGASSSGSNGSISHAQQQRKQQQQHDNSLLATWHEPMVVASSPYGGKSGKPSMRPRCSTMKQSANDAKAAGEAQHVEQVELPSEKHVDLITHYRRTSAGSAHKLISCDGAALKQGETIELLQRSMSTCNSMHNLKNSLRIQEIQESAGEAMVSGTNSEDESCSASSDEMLQSTESSSIGSNKESEPKTAAVNQAKVVTHMLLDEVLLLEKPASSLTGTPMEMSWSEDVEGFEHGSLA